MPAIGPKFEVGERVAFNVDGVEGSGEIGGVAVDDIIAMYIVILDKPINVPGHKTPWKALSVQSSFLRRES